MSTNSKIQVDYTTKTKYFQLVLPINLEINIPVDDSVRLLSNVLEEIDYTELYRAYSRKEKNNVAHTLFPCLKVRVAQGKCRGRKICQMMKKRNILIFL